MGKVDFVQLNLSKYSKKNIVLTILCDIDMVMFVTHT